MSDDREDQVRARAHAIWEAEGRHDGRQDEHWKQAEGEFEKASGSAPTQEAPAEGEADGGSSDAARSAPTQERPAEGDRLTSGQ
jgi:hypothetical protein